MPARPFWISLCGAIAMHGSTACAEHRPLPRPTPAASPAGPVVRSAEAIADGRFPAQHLDCSGFVMAAFRQAGRPLALPDRFARRGGSEASMLFQWARADRRIVQRPQPGDLAFFRDTFGALEGRITHVAMVERVEADGTVAILHVLGSGISRSRMNVERPDDPGCNSWLRKKGGPADRSPKLAGELFVAYARFE